MSRENPHKFFTNHRHFFIKYQSGFLQFPPEESFVNPAPIRQASVPLPFLPGLFFVNVLKGYSKYSLRTDDADGFLFGV